VFDLYLFTVCDVRYTGNVKPVSVTSLRKAGTHDSIQRVYEFGSAPFRLIPIRLITLAYIGENNRTLTLTLFLTPTYRD